MARKRALQAIHPGEVLREEFMKPMGIKAYSLARICRLSGRGWSALSARSRASALTLRCGWASSLAPRRSSG